MEVQLPVWPRLAPLSVLLLGSARSARLALWPRVRGCLRGVPWRQLKRAHIYERPTARAVGSRGRPQASLSVKGYRFSYRLPKRIILEALQDKRPVSQGHSCLAGPRPRPPVPAAPDRDVGDQHSKRDDEGTTTRRRARKEQERTNRAERKRRARQLAVPPGLVATLVAASVTL